MMRVPALAGWLLAAVAHGQALRPELQVELVLAEQTYRQSLPGEVAALEAECARRMAADLAAHIRFLDFVAEERQN